MSDLSEKNLTNAFCRRMFKTLITLKVEINTVMLNENKNLKGQQEMKSTESKKTLNISHLREEFELYQKAVNETIILWNLDSLAGRLTKEERNALQAGIENQIIKTLKTTKELSSKTLTGGEYEKISILVNSITISHVYKPLMFNN